MKKLFQNPESFYSPKKRLSGHDTGTNFSKDNGGAIPSNILSISNTESNSSYMRLCNEFGIERHPARFPEDIPSFFIKFLTSPQDTVLDIFAGSNTTGYAAEKLERNWLAFELSHDYLKASSFRFLDHLESRQIEVLLRELSLPSANIALGEFAMPRLAFG
jgi:site-specific DNA-methyltransferase (cytosine-N4-specific)